MVNKTTTTKKTDKKIKRQSTPHPGLILFWETRDQTQPGSLSFARSVEVARREPWEQGWNNKSWRSEINQKINAAGNRYKLIVSRNGVLYRVQFTNIIAFCPRLCCRKKTPTVCAWSFNLRRDKFVILGGKERGFFALTRCYFNWGTEGKVSPRGAHCQVKQKGVKVFCLLILHVTTIIIRHYQFTSEIYCGTQGRSVYFASRAGRPFHFWSDRAFILSALNKKYDFKNTLQRTFLNRY